ncbi:hypothetical protein TWF281_000385 [Arthrobotrys megalospora]
MADDLAMTDPTVLPPPSHSTQPPKLKQPSYLIAYLQKSELFSNSDKKKNNNNNNNNEPSKFLTKKTSLSNGSSLHSSRGSLDDEDDDEQHESPRSAHSTRNSLMVEQFWANTGLTTDFSSDDAADDEGLEDDDEYDEEDSDEYQDPDELTNLPYKSPAVYQLPGSGNGNKFRTLVRDGPVGSVQGEFQRFVVIKRRSFRGAGLYPGEMVGVDVEMGGCIALYDVDGGKDDGGDDNERLEGEVEVMWSDDGEEFWLVRNPTEDGEIGKETSWVPKEWFLLRRRMMEKAQTGKNKEKVQLRVAMEED